MVSAAEEEAQKAVEKVFWAHRRRYGSRRLLVELQQEEDLVISRYRIRSIMQQQGLKAIQPRSFVPRTTDSTHGLTISPNLLLGKPQPIAPNLCWVGDITYIPLGAVGLPGSMDGPVFPGNCRLATRQTHARRAGRRSFTKRLTQEKAGCRADCSLGSWRPVRWKPVQKAPLQ